MNAATIAAALKGKKSGAGYMALCPAHDDHDPSLTIIECKSGTVLVRCHAGCSQSAVIDELKNRGLWMSAIAPQPIAERDQTEDAHTAFTKPAARRAGQNRRPGK